MQNNKPKRKPKTLLFVLNNFLLAHDFSENTADTYRKIVGVLCNWHASQGDGEKLYVPDFTAGLCNRFLESKQADGATTAYLRSLRDHLLLLKNYLGIGGEIQKYKATATKIEPPKADAPEGTFEHWYWNTHRPKSIHMLAPRSVLENDRIVQYLFECQGRVTLLDQLGDDLVDKLRQWLVDSGRLTTKKTLVKYVRVGYKLFRNAKPDSVRRAWIGRPGGNGRKPIDDGPPEPGSVRHFFETVYRVRKLQARSPNTQRLYLNTFRNFARYLGRTGMMSDLTDDALAGFMGWHVDKGHSPETANKDAGQLAAVARYAARKRFIDVEPELTLLPCPKRAPQAWLRDELYQLFQTVDRLPGHIGQYKARDWWRALLLVIYYTGERVGALRQLTWQSVSLESKWLLVPAEFRKGRREDKAFELADVVVEALGRIRGPADGRLFPWPYDYTYLYKHLKRIHAQAGLPSGRRDLFHRMRRTAASWYKFAGGDPTQLLGHADVRTTQKYLDPRIVDTQSAAKLLDDPTVRKAVVA